MSAAQSSSGGFVRWGVIGCASIARKNVNAIRLSPNSTLVAMASRNKKKCVQWCQDHLTSEENERVKKYGSYTALLEDPDIDAVYLPLPTALHKAWAARVIAAGKHLLIEKPAALCLEDLRETTEACQKHGRVFMDLSLIHI